MRVLVLGSTGKVGLPLTRELVERGHAVRAVARAANPVPGVDAITCDLLDAGAHQSLLEGIQSVFVSLPFGPRETEFATAFAEALRQSEVDHIVQLSVINAQMHSGIPHFASKRICEELLVSSGCRTTVLEANHFFQNDLSFWPAISAGRYPLLYGDRGVHAVDARDVALAAANALEMPDRFHGRWPVAGADLITSRHAAALYAEQLGITIHPLETIVQWDELWEQVGPPAEVWLKADMRAMWEWTLQLGCPATAAQRIAAREIVGARLRCYRDFVVEAAQARSQPGVSQAS